MTFCDLHSKKPDSSLTKAGVLRAELGAHQEHLVDQDAQAADRNKVPSAVINVASHEVTLTQEP